MEFPNDMNALIDAAKFVDLLLLLTHGMKWCVSLHNEANPQVIFRC